MAKQQEHIGFIQRDEAMERIARLERIVEGLCDHDYLFIRYLPAKSYKEGELVYGCRMCDKQKIVPGKEWDEEQKKLALACGGHKE